MTQTALGLFKWRPAVCAHLMTNGVETGKGYKWLYNYKRLASPFLPQIGVGQTDKLRGDQHDWMRDTSGLLLPSPRTCGD